jgi:hypothetical protein
MTKQNRVEPISPDRVFITSIWFSSLRTVLSGAERQNELFALLADNHEPAFLQHADRSKVVLSHMAV